MIFSEASRNFLQIIAISNSCSLFVSSAISSANLKKDIISSPTFMPILFLCSFFNIKYKILSYYFNRLFDIDIKPNWQEWTTLSYTLPNYRCLFFVRYLYCS
jgi:hypothetical protein